MTRLWLGHELESVDELGQEKVFLLTSVIEKRKKSLGIQGQGHSDHLPQALCSFTQTQLYRCGPMEFSRRLKTRQGKGGISLRGRRQFFGEAAAAGLDRQTR
jgi:hypothetical protein